MSNEQIPPGTRVKYWGRAGQGAYYGQEMTLLWKAQCGCKHDMYALEASDGKRFERVLRENFTLLD